MAENTVFLLLKALIRRSAMPLSIRHSRAHQRTSQVDKNGKALSAEYLHGQQIIFTSVLARLSSDGEANCKISQHHYYYFLELT
jgi:hypothetical protein